MNKGLNYAIIETHDIGYQVFTGETLLNDLKVGVRTELYTYHQVKEDADNLYGFQSLEYLELFELLLTVSGIGPKSALGILNVASSDDIKEAIIRNDANLLTKVSGIGKKTAERLILELKNKVMRSGSNSGTLNSAAASGSDEIDALMSLGYSWAEARAALNSVDVTITDRGERVKAALKKM